MSKDTKNRKFANFQTIVFHLCTKAVQKMFNMRWLLSKTTQLSNFVVKTAKNPGVKVKKFGIV